MPERPSVTYTGRTFTPSGGSCSCCGAEGNSYHAGLVDSDGVYYARLCDWGCLLDLALQAQRVPLQRVADMVGGLVGDDLDGAQALMEDYGSAIGRDSVLAPYMKEGR